MVSPPGQAATGGQSILEGLGPWLDVHLVTFILIVLVVLTVVLVDIVTSWRARRSRHGDRRMHGDH